MVQAALLAGLSIADNESIKAFASELLTLAQGTVVEYVLCHVDYIFSILHCHNCRVLEQVNLVKLEMFPLGGQHVAKAFAQAASQSPNNPDFKAFLAWVFLPMPSKCVAKVRIAL